MFSRVTVYAGEQPQSADLLTIERNVAKSLGQFFLDSLAGEDVFSGLPASPGSGLTVVIGYGALYQQKPLDPTAWSSLLSDTSVWPLLGINLTNATLSGFAAPGTSGQSINYLIEAQVQVTDAANTGIPFYNGPPPAPPIMLQKSPSRNNIVAFQVKSGSAAPTGTQPTPSADSGWMPLYVVTVTYGQSSIPSNQIVLATAAPKFYGFVQVNPNGNTPVYLSPALQQTGFINISGYATFGTAGNNSAAATIYIPNNSANAGSTKRTTLGSYSVDNGENVSGITPSLLMIADDGNAAKVAIDTSGNVGLAGGLSINGGISYTGSHAGTDADPLPLSAINASMLGNKIAADYALASGNYIAVYGGTPTLASGNAGITGTFQANILQSNVASGTPPLVVTSPTMVANLNAQFLNGYEVGNTTQHIPISNGNLCLNLNAQYLGGFTATQFQLAGNYPLMNVVNGGNFEVSGSFMSTGGTGSTQVQLYYTSSNGVGINNGGPFSGLYSPNQPLGLWAPHVETTCPVYVGGLSGNQFISASDLWLNGVQRGGELVYRVTRNAGYNGSATPIAPGSGSDYGYWPTPGGGISYSAPGVAETITWRVLITVNSPFTATFNMRANDACSISIDGGAQYHNSGSGALACSFSYSFSAGQHTVDISWSGDGSGGDDHFVLFPWIPYVGQDISTAVKSFQPG